VYSSLGSGTDPERVFTVHTNNRHFHAKTVVLAIGPGNTKNLPWHISNSESVRACHSLDIRAFPAPSIKRKIKLRQETNVVVVGGGLSSAHIIDMAIKAGVSRVWHFTRGDLKGKGRERHKLLEKADEIFLCV
jgi:lysine/ornithine N-monooxygenase